MVYHHHHSAFLPAGKNLCLCTTSFPVENIIGFPGGGNRIFEGRVIKNNENSDDEKKKEKKRKREESKVTT